MAEEKKKGLALAILAAAKPSKKPAEPESDEDEDDAGALSAAEDFVSAVKGGDAAAVLAAFRDLKELA